jgi:DNA-binding NtrC family response regulator
MIKILLIEDEKINRITLEKILVQSGFEVVTAADGLAGLQAFEKEQFDVVLTDLKLPGLTGTELLERFKIISPEIPVLIMTAFATVTNAVESLKKGAYDYFTKPFQPEELINILNNIKREIELRDEVRVLKGKLAGQTENKDIIGQSKKFKHIIEKANTVAPGEHTILIEGESGTGKEVIAGFIVKNSSRSSKPYIRINCSALSETLFESEMFGHEKGAFTGAVKQSKGRFERANGGTIFLDDIDDLSMEMQVKLLRVVQEREIERVGGDKVIPIDVRIIASTKMNLRDKIDNGTFREDLFYRLNVVNLHLPPLRERRSDIPLLSIYFLQKMNSNLTFLPEVIDMLREYDWPGNIRELQNAIEQMVALTSEDTIKMNHLPQRIKDDIAELTTGIQREVWKHILDKQLSLDKTLLGIEVEILKSSIHKFKGNQKNIADYLGIPRTTLRSKLEKHNLI